MAEGLLSAGPTPSSLNRENTLESIKVEYIVYTFHSSLFISNVVNCNEYKTLIAIFLDGHSLTNTTRLILAPDLLCYSIL